MKLKEALEAGKSARSVEFDAPEDYEFVQTLTLLTAKPVLYAANVTEDDLADDGASNEFVGRVREYAAAEHNEVFVLCAKSRRKSPIWTKRTKRNSLPSWAWKPVVWIA